MEGYIVLSKTEGVGMGKTVFVPLTDDLLYEHPEQIHGPVIPFSQNARQTSVEFAAFGSPKAGIAEKVRLATIDTQQR